MEYLQTLIHITVALGIIDLVLIVLLVIQSKSLSALQDDIWALEQENKALAAKIKARRQGGGGSKS